MRSVNSVVIPSVHDSVCGLRGRNVGEFLNGKRGQ